MRSFFQFCDFCDFICFVALINSEYKHSLFWYLLSGFWGSYIRTYAFPNSRICNYVVEEMHGSQERFPRVWRYLLYFSPTTSQAHEDVWVLTHMHHPVSGCLWDPKIKLDGHIVHQVCLPTELSHQPCFPTFLTNITLITKIKLKCKSEEW